MDMVNGEKELNEMTLGKVCDICGIALPESFDRSLKIGMVYAHPMLLKKGAVAFCTVTGKEVEHCKEALKKDASIVLTSMELKNSFFKNEEKVIGIPNVFESIQRYERYIKSLFDLKTVTVTGSVGKTTTTEMVKAVLLEGGLRLTSNYSVDNSHGAILRTMQRIKNDTQIYLQEVGASAIGYVEKSAKGLQPDAVIITNIGDAHLDCYGTREQILKDKASLIDNMNCGGVAFLDLDDPMLRTYKSDKTIKYYAINDKTADYYAENIVSKNTEQNFDIVDKSSGERYRATIQLPGEWNIRNALAAFAVARHFGIDTEHIIRGLGNYRPSGIRQNICNVGGYTLYLDTFNSAPNTVVDSAKALCGMEPEEGGKRNLVVGDMAHLGKEENELHYWVGTELAKLNWDLLVCFGPRAYYIYKGVLDSGVKKNVKFFEEEEREYLNTFIRRNIGRKDITLYKGCQAIDLSRTIDAVYGTSFYHNNEMVSVNFEEVRYRTIGEYYREFNKLMTPNVRKLRISDESGCVRRISPDACREQNKLEQVVIDDGIVNIGQAAFFRCFHLKSVTLGRGLRFIEANAFNSCVRLENICIPEGSIHIGDRAFYDCYALESVTIPASVGFIGEDVFTNCQKLTLYLEKGSYAEEYAKENNLKYEYISSQQEG